MRTYIISMALLMATDSFAGTWKCIIQKTDSGVAIVDLTARGDEAGIAGGSFVDTVMSGIPSGRYSVRVENREAGEFQRVMIGEEDPRSTMRLRILESTDGTHLHPARLKQMFNPMPTELSETCELQ